jgi:hypothetical protein
MQPCRCALCGTDARREDLAATTHSIDCPACGTFYLTAGARVAWSSLDAVKKETTLANLRAVMHERRVVISHEDIMRAAGVR